MVVVGVPKAEPNAGVAPEPKVLEVLNPVPEIGGFATPNAEVAIGCA